MAEQLAVWTSSPLPRVDMLGGAHHLPLGASMDQAGAFLLQGSLHPTQLLSLPYQFHLGVGL